MDSAHSARGTAPTPMPAVMAGYGLAEYGASWSDSDRVLVTVHGRDRTSDELPIGFVSHPVSRVTRILAPHANSKSWYDSRYDAPRAENADQVNVGLGKIAAAFALAGEKGIPTSKIVLAGFSQGGCMVAEYLLSGAQRPAAAAIFTGSVLDIAHPRQPTAGLAGMPVVLSGGDADPWLPAADLRATGTLLEALGADVRFQIFPDGDHVVRSQEMSLLGELVQGVGPRT
ncbi:dienelactone hydrolase family protein [Pelagibacterium nitratireducens]|uniref:Dienelactone hydrolase family protein n=1 Tax=Pelagibacterium nitratireducens TaxID=1046114 RepID=A0ABZ2HXY0_9HYPH